MAAHLAPTKDFHRLSLNDRLHERDRAIQAIYNEVPEQVASTDHSSSSPPQSVQQNDRKLFKDNPTMIRLLYALSVLQFCIITQN